VQIDDFNTGDRAQNVLGRFDDSMDARMAVQCDPHRHGLTQQRPQSVEILADEQREWRHFERPRTARLFDRRQCRLGELHLTRRTPRQHLPALAARKLVERAFGDTAGCRDVAGAHLHDAAAMRRSAHHLIGDAERIHDVEGEECDVRRLEHVAAGVKNEIRRLFCATRLLGALPQALQQCVIELDARQMRDLARNFAETIDAIFALYCRVGPARHLDPRHVQQEARINAVVAGLDTFARENAGIGPFAGGLIALAGAHNVDDAVNDCGGILQLFRRESAWPGDRANLNAFAATGAGIGHGQRARFQGGFECLHRRVGRAL
jgi:hypothetical protein